MKTAKFIIAAVIAAASIPALAGSATGKVTGIIVTVGVVIFSVENQPNLPACAVARAYAIDGSTSDGKNTLAFVLSAASQGKPITVVGRGNCSLTGDRETVLYVGAGY